MWLYKRGYKRHASAGIPAGAWISMFCVSAGAVCGSAAELLAFRFYPRVAILNAPRANLSAVNSMPRTSTRRGWSKWCKALWPQRFRTEVSEAAMLQRIGPIKAAWILTTCVMICAAGATPISEITGVYEESTIVSTRLIPARFTEPPLAKRSSAAS